MAVVAEEWLSQNAGRAYPFRENAPLQLRTAAGNRLDLRIPNGLFVDTLITVPEQVSRDVYLAKLARIDTSLSFTFAHADAEEIGTVAVDLGAHAPFSTYAFNGVGDYADVRGNVAIGDLRQLDLPDGSYVFEPGDAPLALAAVRPTLRGVQSLRIQDINGLSDLIQRNVNLQGGSNIRLSYDADNNTIRIDALSSAGFEEQCECDDTETEPPNVQRINGIALEDVTIKGDGVCTEVLVEGNTITIKNTCADPCCGCKELEAIRERIELVSQATDKLESYLAKVEGEFLSFQTGVLYST